MLGIFFTEKIHPRGDGRCYRTMLFAGGYCSFAAHDEFGSLHGTSGAYNGRVMRDGSAVGARGRPARCAIPHAARSSSRFLRITYEVIARSEKRRIGPPARSMRGRNRDIIVGRVLALDISERVIPPSNEWIPATPEIMVPLFGEGDRAFLLGRQLLAHCKLLLN